jgi:hypothetical protein
MLPTIGRHHDNGHAGIVILDQERIAGDAWAALSRRAGFRIDSDGRTGGARNVGVNAVDRVGRPCRV